MPILMAVEGEEYEVMRIGGSPEAKRHLSELGFVPEARVTVISKNGENMIVKIFDSRIAISKEMAGKIIVKEAA